MNKFEKWLQKCFRHLHPIVHQKELQFAKTGWKACLKEHNVEAVCKAIEDSKFTVEEAVRILKDVRQLINNSGFSKEDFLERFLPE